MHDVYYSFVLDPQGFSEKDLNTFSGKPCKELLILTFRRFVVESND